MCGKDIKMSKDIINEDGTIEIKKSMTVEKRSMSKNNEENPESHLNLSELLNQKSNEK